MCSSDLPDALAEDVAALAAVAEQRGADPLAWVLTGGEDHGLLATFGPGTALPEPFRAIGSVGEGPAGVTYGGQRPPVSGTGWDHFRSDQV